MKPLSDVVARLDGIASANNQRALGFLTRPLRGQRRGSRVPVSSTIRRAARNGLSSYSAKTFFAKPTDRALATLSFRHSILPDPATFSRSAQTFSERGILPLPTAWHTEKCGRAGPGIRAKFVQVEPRMSQTGANADEWVPVKPGTEGVLALGLAHVILKDRLRTPFSRRKSRRTDRRLEHRACRDLHRQRSKNEPALLPPASKGSLVSLRNTARPSQSIGGAPLAHTNGMFQALAVNALNALVGNVGQAGGIFFTPRPGHGRNRRHRRASSS